MTDDSVRERENHKPSKRFPNVTLRYWVYQFLKQRDGPKCIVCGVSEAEKELVVDHLDNNPYNNEPSNLRLLCRSCNEREYWRQMKEMTNVTTPQGECVSVYANRLGGGGGERVEFAVSVGSNASAELKVNRDKEPWYRRVVLEAILRDGSMRLEDAIDAAAETVGISPVTSRRYLKKMMSSSGMLFLDETGVGKLLKIKPEYWEKLSKQDASKGLYWANEQQKLGGS